MKYRFLFVLFAALALDSSLLAQGDTAYVNGIERWHAQRMEGLKAANGWLNLVGLYWLDEGKNAFGSGADNKIVFPAGSIGVSAGYFERKGNVVTLVATDPAVTIDKQAVKEAVIFSPDVRRAPVVAAGSLRWSIIQRDDKIGIRLRDLNAPLVKNFKGVDRFRVDTAWRIAAVFEPALVPRSIPITNVLGQTTQQNSPGKLIFSIGKTRYTLDALEEGDEFFIIFADATSGSTTYPAGRFLSVAKPVGDDNRTVIDFNKAYNPPCAFTSYATCPLPPRQNVLPVEVAAGEKTYGHHGE